MPPNLPRTQQLRSYRAPVGMPKGREDWRIGTAVSVLVHIGVLVLIVAPFAAGADLMLREQGAGGPGPAGGGGGGTRGSGGAPERLTFVTVAPPPTPQAEPVKLEVPPLPKPEPIPDFRLPDIAQTPTAPVAPIAGVGGGTGADGSAGSGPGSGGGVGSGIGTGRGSGVGAGTGGGGQENYPPTPIEIFIPPMPVPNSVRGFHLIAEFDVDETGKVRGMEFTPTPDRGYNRRLRDVLGTFRFRPGTRPDGTPIRMKAQIAIDLP